MWSAVLTVCVIATVLVGAWFKIVAKQLRQKEYSQKMNKMNEAKDVLLTNKRLVAHYNKLIDIYSDETGRSKNQLSDTVMKIIRETNDVQTATAVCALAKIESNRRLNKDVTKS